MKVLVIRLGALGDVVLSFSAFSAIRARHRSDDITLLTTAPFASLLRRSPWFDRVTVDARPSWWNFAGLVRLGRQLRGFDFVYDLQTSRRSSAYFWLAGRPAWSGIAAGSSHPHANPARDAMHTLERQREQLAAAGVREAAGVDLSWLATAPAPTVTSPFAVLVPGASPHRPAKRWPAERFGHLATLLAGRGLQPVVVGSSAETPLADTIRRVCPGALDLTGRTDLPGLGALLARAALAVGNDTGPMHLAAATGCPTLTLFSGDSDPALTAPRTLDGGFPPTLQVSDLADLPVSGVAASLPPAR